MGIRYVLTEDRHTVDGKQYTFYGIAACEGEQTVCAARDICTDGEHIAWLVERCNCLRLSPIHLCDVVEDLLVKAPTDPELP